jgi:hypothetical protein
MIKNKRQGDKWNYDVIRFLATIFKLEAFNNKNHKTYEISTTKNTPLDGEGIDVFYRDTVPNYIQRLKVQCKKTMIKGKNSISLLTMRIKAGEIPLLFTRMTKKVTVKEQVLDELVIMRMEDFKLFLNEYVKSCKGL